MGMEPDMGDDKDDGYDAVIDAVNALENAEGAEAKAAAWEKVFAAVKAYGAEEPEPPPELAGVNEIVAFSAAATALAPLTVKMRAAAIHALDVLMLPPVKKKPFLSKEQLKLAAEMFPNIFQTIMAATQPPPLGRVYTVPVPQPGLTPQAQAHVQEQIRRARTGLSDVELENIMTPPYAKAEPRDPYVVSPDGTVRPPIEKPPQHVGTVLFDYARNEYWFVDGIGSRYKIPIGVVSGILSGDATPPLS